MSTENAPAAADPSMEDILASIRRILNEEDVKPPEPEPDAEPEADVLVLDQSMMVSAPVAAQSGPPTPMPTRMPGPEPAPVEKLVATVHSVAPIVALPVHATPVFDPAPPAETAPPSMPEPVMSSFDDAPLVAPAAAAAAASSVGALLQTLAHERGTAVSRSGPTIEDLVRDEMRPMLKDWLDTHLPPIVERLVRAEIERVVNRTG